jgi:biopolymer transport protein ExbD
MAVIRQKGSKEVPAISTSSLPDIIFMLLFFFMITTTMREQTLLVTVRLPAATEIAKLEKKSLASYIYVGSPVPQQRAQLGDAPRIQLNDSVHSVQEIGQFIAAERESLAEADQSGMTTVLKADASTLMGLVQDVKMELRKANALGLIYAAVKP